MVSLSYLIRTVLSGQRRAERDARRVVSRGKDSPVFSPGSNIFCDGTSRARLGRVLTLSENRSVAKIRPR
jgi:hypothetical protein